MNISDFAILKNCTDSFEYHLIGNFYYRAGKIGLSKHNKKFNIIGHSNYFRDKDFKTVKKELNIKIEVLN